MGAHEERELRHAVAPPQNLPLRRQQPPGKLHPKPPCAGRRRGRSTEYIIITRRGEGAAAQGAEGGRGGPFLRRRRSGLRRGRR